MTNLVATLVTIDAFQTEVWEMFSDFSLVWLFLKIRTGTVNTSKPLLNNSPQNYILILNLENIQQNPFVRLSCSVWLSFR